CQLGYLDPDGRKSLVLPVRRRFNLETAPGAVFELPSPSPGARDALADTVFVEGLEDAGSIYQLARNWAMKGLPGLGALAHVIVKKGERVLVIADGDTAGSAAAKALTRGVDELILKGAEVQLAVCPPGEDANSILAEHKSIADLIKLVAG